MANGNDPKTTDRSRAEAPPQWRSRAERTGSEAFRAAAAREFKLPLPIGQEVDRRRFLQLMGASAALGGLTGCARQPFETIVPYVRQPEEVVPGRPLYFASAVTEGGYATGVLVESHEGRPTKIEGNPGHPASLGGTTARQQASILDLYDPGRSQALTHLGRIRTWSEFVSAVITACQAQEGSGGAGLRFLTHTVTSPTLAAQIEGILEYFPQARWYQYDAAGRQSARMAAKAAFGEGVDVHYDLEAADVIVTLDADLLVEGPAAVRYAKQFSRRRQAGQTNGINRLYAIESTPTHTGTCADHRLVLDPARVDAFATALAARVGVGGATAGELDEETSRWIEAIAKDLEAHRGRCLVAPGVAASTAIHVLAHAINDQLGNVGTTVIPTAPVEAKPADEIDDLRRLTRELEDNQVEVLFVLDANPVYDAPADLDFASALLSDELRLRVHIGNAKNETTPLCHWHVPMAHFLETWGDARAFDGTVTIQQPLILPLYGGRSILEVLAVVEGRPGTTAYDIVQEYWVQRLGDEAAWRRALHDGVVPDSGAPSVEATVRPAAVEAAMRALGQGTGDPGLELLFRPDPLLHDGSSASNGWLLECPRPFTKLTWDNALLISPRTARDQGIEETGEMVTVTAGDRTLDVPVFILPGQADGTLTLHLGWGRRGVGDPGSGHGVDASTLRTSETMWRVGGVSIARTGAEYALASTQEHHSMENRPLVRAGSVAEYEEDPHFVKEMAHSPAADMTLYPAYPYDGYAWGMVFNLSTCTGCSACLVACQSENNIPVVGKKEVLNGREMHWIRIDRYFVGDEDSPDAIYNQPIPCMQCENAHCEPVCPVAATVHSDEGLNDMVYNRCVGTRYCADNCPYKVRRFNFFKYQDFETPSLKLMRNPDVTIRFRGVMEKCTYCVQRINQGRIAARRDDRMIADGDVKTACQQACPSDAIVFGDINTEGSQVQAWKDLDINYGLLEDLNSRPRTTYLARITNPNPELEHHS